MSTALRDALFRASPDRVVRASHPLRSRSLAVAGGLVVSIGAAAMLVAAGCTAFRARPLYRGMARLTALMVLRVYGIRLHTHAPSRLLPGQVVFISNHTSSLDLFVLVALGLPRCRFFLSGFLRRLIPLGVIAWLLGTFFTVPQDQPQERTRIFQRAERVLRATGESVYVSPEGGRVTTGSPGHFNRGAFHLALNLGAPIVPFHIRIPPAVDPGLGFDARPGTVDVVFLPAIETRGWSLKTLEQHIAAARNVLVRAHEEWSCPS
ncbi:MAG: lysophospholipid acyltransferase family protein [Vicinamibacterales bacterium]